jgi:hypothetical protein
MTAYCFPTFLFLVSQYKENQHVYIPFTLQPHIMKNATLFLAAVLLLSTTALIGQESSKKRERRLWISEIQILPGAIHSRSYPGTLEQFRILAPGSEMLANQTFEGYQSGNGYIRTHSGVFAAMLGIRFKTGKGDEYRGDPTLRIGFSFNGGTQLTYLTSHVASYPIDTLYNTQGTQVATIDSVAWKTYNMTYSSDQWNLDVSLIYRTNPKLRFSLFGGIGVTGGMSVASFARMGMHDASYIETRFKYSHFNSSWVFDNTHDKVEAPGNISGNIYLPMGVNFRLGNKSALLRKINIFYEVRPGITLTSLEGIETLVSTRTLHGIGLRLAW